MDSHSFDFGGPVHYQEAGTGGPRFLFVHGLGGSHVNWSAVAPRVAQRGRVYVPDLVGHGRTPPAGRTSSLQVNAALLARFIEEVVGPPAIVVGNSMGGLLGLLLTGSRPNLVAGLVLVNPSLPRGARDPIDPEISRNFAAYAIPGMGERFLRARRVRLGPEGLVADTLRYCTADPSRVPPEVVEAALTFARERATLPYGDASFLEAARSILRIHATRRSAEVIRRLPKVPTLLLHGTEDRLVPVKAARRTALLRPDWTYTELPGVGHVPQLETPDAVVDTLWSWLEGAGAPALRAAGPRAASGKGS